MIERRPRSPSQSFNAGIDAALVEVARVMDEVGPGETMAPVFIKIVSRVSGIKRRTWHRQPRGTGGEYGERK